MAFLEQAVRSARAGAADTQSGTPKMSKTGTGMGSVVSSRPATTPASPGLASAPPGAPTAPKPLGGAPSYPAPPVLTSPSAQKPVSPALPRPGNAGGGNAGASSASAPSAAPGQNGAVGPAPPRQFTGMPRASDIRGLQPGEQAMSPWGPVILDEKGEPRVQFTPEGEVAYRKAVVQSRKKFGPYLGSGDPSAPHPPIQPGQTWFNPQTGQWVEV